MWELPGGAGRGVRPGTAAHPVGPLLHGRLQAATRRPVQVRGLKCSGALNEFVKHV